MDVEEYRRTSRQVWEAMGPPGWQRWRAQLAEPLSPVREYLIGKLGPTAPRHGS